MGNGNLKEYKAHPLADAFPMMPDEEIEALAEDIFANGLHLPITLYEGKILDGRNRYAALKKDGMEEVDLTDAFRDFDKNKNPSHFVLSMNGNRRSMSKSQKAMAGAKLVETRWGGNNKKASGNLTACTVGDASKKLTVGEKTIRMARDVLKHPKVSKVLTPAVADGLIAVSDATKNLDVAVDILKKALDSVKESKEKSPENPTTLTQAVRKQSGNGNGSGNRGGGSSDKFAFFVEVKTEIEDAPEGLPYDHDAFDLPEGNMMEIVFEGDLGAGIKRYCLKVKRNDDVGWVKGLSRVSSA